jgi:phenylpropionate dioxygenase-like ring-hydroxylating dioxygenase large terminal subunit
MYPLRNGLLFARNQWYVAAWSSEISTTPLARTIMGDRLVLFRINSEEVGALEDSCIHRRFPLSLGRVDGNDIVCEYHGFQFDRSGKCTAIATQERIPSGFAVRSYPTIEKWEWI